MLKNTLKKALIAAFALAATALYLDATGYKDFDTKLGNPLCALDPTCRPMTQGEVSLAKEKFGDTIDYTSVKIFNRINYTIAPLKKILGLNYAAEAPNGNVYYIDQKQYSPDFSKETEKKKQPIFLHELTHVWQKHNGYNTLLRSTHDYIEANFNYREMYSFDIYSKKSFHEFGIEQQAETVEEYHKILLSAPESRTEKQQKGYCSMVRQYEKKIGEEIPLTPFKPCKP